MVKQKKNASAFYDLRTVHRDHEEKKNSSEFFDLQIKTADYIIPIKLFSSRRPAAPLFSGWNWTPKTFRLPTDEANGQM